MRLPPLLLGAALAFWGWQTGYLPLGLAMAAVSELRHVTRWRADLGLRDLNRVSDLSAVLFVALVAWQALAGEAARAIIAVFQWLPLVLFPLVVCQLYGVTGRVDASVFLWSLRRRALARGHGTQPVDLAWPFLALIVLSASAANVRTPSFYAGLVLLAGWALWGARARRDTPTIWACMLAGAVALGWAGQVGLAEGQQVLMRATTGWILEYWRRDTDPYRSSTAMGQVGEVKLSDRIVLRLEASPGLRPPFLLREATYNVYHAASWYAADAAFERVQPEADGATWRIGPEAPETGALTVSTYLKGGKGILPAATGTYRLDDLLVVELRRNRLGALRVEEGLGLVTYRARFGEHREGPPAPSDVAVPRLEAEAVGRVAAELGLADLEPERAVQAVQSYFRSRFRYARFLTGTPVDRTALGDFLTRTRAGHCEYFATATVLLLRAAGIPARYAVGWSAQEWSQLEGRYVVRARDAHAWAVAWVDGAWRDVDTTPPDWFVEEAADGPIFGALADLGAWVTFQFYRWRWSEREDRLTTNVGWLVLPLMGFLAWRIYSRRRAAVAPAPAARAATRRDGQGRDSEFYRVEALLAARGLARGPDEPLGPWLRGLAERAEPEFDVPALEPLVRLHYRYRFDPAGLAPAERRALGAGVEAWLAARDRDPARGVPAS